MSKNPIIYETGASPQRAVIWLHGLGADGNDFTSIIPALQLPQDLAVRFIFPHAPHRTVTLNAGASMRAWYDIRKSSLKDDIDFLGIEESVQSIHILIQEQIDAGISAEKIILAGFSQGGVISLSYLMVDKESLGGIIALSAYIPSNTVKKLYNRSPVFLGHGVYDEIVPFIYHSTNQKELGLFSLDIQAHDYPEDHSVSPQEILDISLWLQQKLA